MVLHTSAIIAILRGDRERREFLEAIEAAESLRMSVATFVEISMLI